MEQKKLNLYHNNREKQIDYFFLKNKQSNNISPIIVYGPLPSPPNERLACWPQATLSFLGRENSVIFLVFIIIQNGATVC